MLTWFTGLPDWIKFVLILVIFFLIYMIYMMINYNRVKKQVLEMQNTLKVNDLVMTQSGLYGTLTALYKNTAELKLADNMVIMIDRFSIKNKVADPAKLKETAE
jgi:preprotein translocase subunit YajC